MLLSTTNNLIEPGSAIIFDEGNNQISLSRFFTWTSSSPSYIQLTTEKKIIVSEKRGQIINDEFLLNRVPFKIEFYLKLTG